jgi:hypothetical protein
MYPAKHPLRRYCMTEVLFLSSCTAKKKTLSFWSGEVICPTLLPTCTIKFRAKYSCPQISAFDAISGLMTGTRCWQPSGVDRHRCQVKWAGTDVPPRPSRTTDGYKEASPESDLAKMSFRDFQVAIPVNYMDLLSKDIVSLKIQLCSSACVMRSAEKRRSASFFFCA